MRRTTETALALLLLGACSPGPFECPNDPATPVPDVTIVCAHITSIGCLIDPDPDAEDAGIAPSCEIGYEEVRAGLPTDEFERLLRCYVAADECEDLEGCNQSCGPGGGHIGYRPGVDAAVPDAGHDAGTDAAVPPVDAGEDAGSDAGFDAGGEDDAGAPDAGVDAGTDAATPDAGVDAG